MIYSNFGYCITRLWRINQSDWIVHSADPFLGAMEAALTLRALRYGIYPPSWLNEFYPHELLSTNLASSKGLSSLIRLTLPDLSDIPQDKMSNSSRVRWARRSILR